MKVFKDFPTERPVTRFLDNIESPEDLKKLTIDELEVLADELREYLLENNILIEDTPTGTVWRKK